MTKTSRHTPDDRFRRDPRDWGRFKRGYIVHFAPKHLVCGENLWFLRAADPRLVLPRVPDDRVPPLPQLFATMYLSVHEAGDGSEAKNWIVGDWTSRDIGDWLYGGYLGALSRISAWQLRPGDAGHLMAIQLARTKPNHSRSEPQTTAHQPNEIRTEPNKVEQTGTAETRTNPPTQSWNPLNQPGTSATHHRISGTKVDQSGQIWTKSDTQDHNSLLRAAKLRFSVQISSSTPNSPEREPTNLQRVLLVRRDHDLAVLLGIAQRLERSFDAVQADPSRHDRSGLNAARR